MIPTIHESNKITGLVLTFVALLLALVVGGILVLFTGLGETTIGIVLSSITTLGASHQAAEAIQKRGEAASPFYQAANSNQPVVIPPPGTSQPPNVSAMGPPPA